jgi:hypothetical protein
VNPSSTPEHVAKIEEKHGKGFASFLKNSYEDRPQRIEETLYDHSKEWKASFGKLRFKMQASTIKYLWNALLSYLHLRCILSLNHPNLRIQYAAPATIRLLS